VNLFNNYIEIVRCYLHRFHRRHHQHRVHQQQLIVHFQHRAVGHSI